MTVDAEISGKTHPIQANWEFNDQGNSDITTMYGYFSFRRDHILELSNTSSIDLILMILGTFAAFLTFPILPYRHYFQVEIGAVVLNPLVVAIDFLGPLQPIIAYSLLFVLCSAILCRFMVRKAPISTIVFVRALFPVIPLFLIIGFVWLFFLPFILLLIYPFALAIYTMKTILGSNQSSETNFSLKTFLILVIASVLLPIPFSHPYMLPLTSAFLIIIWIFGIILAWGEWPSIGLTEFARFILLDREAVKTISDSDTLDNIILVGIMLITLISAFVASLLLPVMLCLLAYLTLIFLTTLLTRRWDLTTHFTRLFFPVLLVSLIITAAAFYLDFIPLIAIPLILLLIIPAVLQFQLTKQLVDYRIWQGIVAIGFTVCTPIIVSLTFAPIIVLTGFFLGSGAIVLLKDFF